MVIPVFNASSHIRECLDCVFSSEFKEFEIVLVDDGSTDDTLTKISPFSCRVLENETNLGAAASRNRGAKEAKAGIVLFIDSDVLIPPDLLGRVWKFFEEYPKVSVLQGRYGDKPYYQNLLSQYKHYIFSFRGLVQGQTYVRYIHTACAAMRKDVFLKFQFDEKLRRREDIEYGLRLSKNGYLIFADSTLVVGHKRKYDLISFSAYQFHAVEGLVLQYKSANDRNLFQEFRSEGHSLYKKLWLLRPLLFFFAFIGLIWSGLGGMPLSILFLLGIFISSILLEYQFRLYLLRTASISVSLGACWLYFYDGLMIGLGVLSGILRVRKVPSGEKLENR